MFETYRALKKARNAAEGGVAEAMLEAGRHVKLATELDLVLLMLWPGLVAAEGAQPLVQQGKASSSDIGRIGDCAVRAARMMLEIKKWPIALNEDLAIRIAPLIADHAAAVARGVGSSQAIVGHWFVVVGDALLQEHGSCIPADKWVQCICKGVDEAMAP